jgi:hypothetical protein
MIDTQHPRPSSPVPPQHVNVGGWEVERSDGSVVYRGRDITLAEEIYHALPAGAHIHRA